MRNETHKTAIVVIPPEEVWPSIQAIRKEHDRKARRWMPHITMIYPFRPIAEFDSLKERLTAACDGLPPFEVQLAGLHVFRHRGDNYTIWLEPEPQAPLVDLYRLLRRTANRAKDADTPQPRFQPHLSVGQVRGRTEMIQLVDGLQAAWKPVRFRISDVSLIWRSDPPDDVFRVAYSVPLGGDR